MKASRVFGVASTLLPPARTCLWVRWHPEELCQLQPPKQPSVFHGKDDRKLRQCAYPFDNTFELPEPQNWFSVAPKCQDLAVEHQNELEAASSYLNSKLFSPFEFLPPVLRLGALKPRLTHSKKWADAHHVKGKLGPEPFVFKYIWEV